MSNEYDDNDDDSDDDDDNDNGNDNDGDLRELGSPNPVISFTWGCYRSLSGNRVAQVGRVTF